MVKRKKTLTPAAAAEDIISAMVDTLVLVGRDGRILRTNQATLDLLGYKENELVGEPITKILPTTGAGSSLYSIFQEAGLRELIKKGHVRDVEITYKTKDGREVPLSFSGSEIREGKGELQGIVCVAKDLRDIKRAEEELRVKAAELARSNAELEHFAYVASHDLQQPLCTVESYLLHLKQQCKGKLDAEANESIAYAVDGSSKMRALLSGLLEYSRVNTQGNPLEPTNSAVVFNQVIANLKALIKTSGAVVTRDPLPMVMADNVQLIRLFQNLIANAIKFRGEEPPRVHVSARQGKEEWIFSIRDNGIGIPLEYAESIFEMFRRLHSETKYPGTGIGLAVCKKIVERHGGRIWVKSRSGKGSTFYFTLPKKEIESVTKKQTRIKALVESLKKLE
jgi:PAS domain S-box-containing protein